jgi:endonuclease III
VFHNKIACVQHCCRQSKVAVTCTAAARAALSFQLPPSVRLPAVVVIVMLLLPLCDRSCTKPSARQPLARPKPRPASPKKSAAGLAAAAPLTGAAMSPCRGTPSSHDAETEWKERKRLEAGEEGQIAAQHGEGGGARKRRKYAAGEARVERTEAGTEEELGGLLQQLQCQREEEERKVRAEKQAQRSKRAGASCIDGAPQAVVDVEDAALSVIFPEDGGGESANKLRVLEQIVTACPRGPVFDFHKYLMRLKDEPSGDFLCLCAALLSVQCLDHVAMKACERLRIGVPGFSAQAVAAVGAEEIEPLVKTCNYYKGKAKKIVNCAAAIVRRHKGKVPRSLSLLLELDGVGIAPCVPQRGDRRVHGSGVWISVESVAGRMSLCAHARGLLFLASGFVLRVEG